MTNQTFITNTGTDEQIYSLCKLGCKAHTHTGHMHQERLDPLNSAAS